MFMTFYIRKQIKIYISEWRAIIWKKNYYADRPYVSDDDVEVTIWKLNEDGTLGDVAKNVKIAMQIFKRNKI